MAQVPGVIKERAVGVANDAEIGEIEQGFLGTSIAQDAGAVPLAEYLEKLYVKQMWRVEFFRGAKDVGLYACSVWCAQQQIKGGRGVYDDQRVSRSSRTASAAVYVGAAAGSTLLRVRRRAWISVWSGREAMCSIWSSRYCERDLDESAARDLSLRCRSSGTFRIWIIVPMC